MELANVTSAMVPSDVCFQAVAKLTSMIIPVQRTRVSGAQCEANYVVGTDADGATSTAQGVQRPLCCDEVDDWISGVKCADHRLQTRRGLMDTTLTRQNWC